VWLVVLMCCAATAGAGDIQVLCDPGLDVYLDDTFVGTSSEREDGLYLLDVKEGRHVLRVTREGFLPRVYEIEVVTLPIEVTVEPLEPAPPEPVPAPAPSPAPARTELVGNLVVTSAPQNCTVEIDGRVEEKSTPQLEVGGLAAGDHTIVFKRQGFDPISGTITIQPGVRLVVRGNLKDGRVEQVHIGKGSLRVLSKPQRCTVQILGMRREKTLGRLNMSYLPAGEHELTVSIRGRQMSHPILIMNRHRTIVEVSFVEGDRPFVVTYVPLGE
jgi:hypothetical protein